MAKNWKEATSLLSRLGKFEILDIKFKMDRNETTYHQAKHKYRELMIMPFIALSNNCDFVLNKGEKIILTSDGVKCKVLNWKEMHVCQLEDKVKELYGVDIWSFIKKWYNSDCAMDSMYFFVIKVEKI